MKLVLFTSMYFEEVEAENMACGYPTDNTALSSILAQLLEPPSLPRTAMTDQACLTEESDLALMLRMLLTPDSSNRKPQQAQAK